MRNAFVRVNHGRMSWIDLADQSMVGRTGSVRRRIPLRGGVGAAGRIALPIGKMVGRTGLGPPKNPLRAASPYLCEAFQHSRKPDAKSSGWALIHASSTGIGSHIADSISAAGKRMLP